MMHKVLITILALPSVLTLPNILIMIADDLGYGDLGCYGNNSVRTPNIDKLAAEGVKMTHHLTAESLCTPSRAAFLTGRYPMRSGMSSLGTMRINVWAYSSCGLPANETTFAEQAKKAGYKTGFIGKWHLGLHKDRLGDFAHHPLNQGFDHFYGSIGTNMEDFGDKGTKIIHSMRPYWYGELFTVWAVTAMALWCLYKSSYLNFGVLMLLILIWSVPIFYMYFIMDNFKLLSSFLHRNYNLVEQPIRLPGLSQRLVAEGKEFLQNASQSGSPFLLVMSWLHMHVFLQTSKEFEGQSKFGRYGDALEEMDWSVGEMLKYISKLGMDENTIVYFTSDNGGHLEIGTNGGYNGHLKGGKGHGAPDGGIRVPGIIKWPGIIPPNSVTDEMTSQMDIFKLVSSALAVPLPNDVTLDGNDVLPLLRGLTNISPHSFLFHYCGNRLHAVRYRERTGSKTWKLVLYEPALWPGTNLCKLVCSCNNAIALNPPKLYDITSDPGETTPIQSDLQIYKDVSEIVNIAILNHRKSLTPVESQFTWGKLAPKLSWQPCCNGVFPFNCLCVDKKYPV